MTGPPAPPAPPSLILASASAARRAMLAQAGLAFETVPAHVDEESFKASMRAEGATPAQAASALALLKAQRISERYRDRLVIGADQILVHDERWFDKPTDRAGAAAQLRTLRGGPHTLATAAVVARNGARLWGHVETPRLVMRAFTDTALEAYLDAMGDTVTTTVGGYMLEGLGVTLFAKVEGDWFSILGMPLLPLLGFLRQHGALAA